MDGPGRCSCRRRTAKVAKDGMHLLVRAPGREYDRTMHCSRHDAPAWRSSEQTGANVNEA